MGGVLIPALLCAALGLALAFQTKRMQWLSIAVLGAMACLVVWIDFPQDWMAAVFVAGWVSLIVTALSVLAPARLPAWLPLSLAANAGLWTGSLIAMTAQPSDLVLALPLVLIAFPARWVLNTPARLGVKIVAGWLVAVAILGVGVSMLPTPGYKADHIE